jgi:hypothetical protein
MRALSRPRLRLWGSQRVNLRTSHCTWFCESFRTGLCIQLLVRLHVVCCDAPRRLVLLGHINERLLLRTELTCTGSHPCGTCRSTRGCRHLRDGCRRQHERLGQLRGLPKGPADDSGRRRSDGRRARLKRARCCLKLRTALCTPIAPADDPMRAAACRGLNLFAELVRQYTGAKRQVLREGVARFSGLRPLEPSSPSQAGLEAQHETSKCHSGAWHVRGRR